MSYFVGKNDLPSREMFIERNVYDGYVLAELNKVEGLELETLQIKDFRKNEKLLVGRVDSLGTPILVDGSYLTTPGGSVGASNASALNFVVSSFQDMEAIFNNDLRLGKISVDSPALGELKMKKGFVDPKRMYIDYQTKTRQKFVEHVETQGLLKNIVNFESFVEIYMDYVNSYAPLLPFTETMYILTRSNSVMSSGLAFEIHEGDYGDDSLKVEMFYNDPNFEYLKNLAYSHGFVIDKHIPWRLVADMASPNMSRYLRDAIDLGGLPIGPAVVIAKMFTQPHFDDLTDIANMMIDTYNAIVQKRPRTVIKVTNATTSPASAKTVFRRCKKTKVILRRQTSLDEVGAMPASYWVDKYVKIRNAETGLGYDDATVNVIIKNASDLINSFDTIAAMRYIASKFDNVAHLEGSLFYDITRIEMSQDPNATESSVKERVQRSVQDSNFVQY